jgi:hypothetical protein
MGRDGGDRRQTADYEPALIFLFVEPEIVEVGDGVAAGPETGLAGL